MDLVYERNRQFYETKKLPTKYDLTTITRIIWYNKQGKFQRVRIEDPQYYKSYDIRKKKLIIEHAKSLGTTALRYTPKQQFYEYEKNGNYIHYFRKPLAKPFQDKVD